MTSGMVRSITMGSYTGLEVCSKMQWKPFFQLTEPFKGRRINGLVGHWRMDEQSGNEVADDSGSENHSLAIRAVPKLAKFSRGRFFNSTGLIRVPNSARLNFGVVSFTVMGWIKVLDVKNPLTTFAAKKGFGCYFGSGRPGGLPGWEIGHGYRVTGLRVCIRDEQHRMVSKVIVFDDGYDRHSWLDNGLITLSCSIVRRRSILILQKQNWNRNEREPFEQRHPASQIRQKLKRSVSKYTRYGVWSPIKVVFPLLS